MEQVLLDQIIALRAQLHACAEVSGREAVTKHTLLTFLREHTSLELHELAGGFYAAHREPEGTKPTVALRADYDALATPQGGAAHLCGHDGHAARRSTKSTAHTTCRAFRSARCSPARAPLPAPAAA